MTSYRRRRNKIDGPFVMHTRELLESPAWRVLTGAAHSVLARIEIEHMHQGGQLNGQLIVTFDQFERYGVHRHAIAPAIRELEALKLIERTQVGRGGNAEYRTPNWFRLTYLKTTNEPPTNEWHRIDTVEGALLLRHAARTGRRRKPQPITPPRALRRSQTQQQETRE